MPRWVIWRNTAIRFPIAFECGHKIAIRPHNGCPQLLDNLARERCLSTERTQADFRLLADGAILICRTFVSAVQYILLQIMPINSGE
ncbi:hypothetical protein Bphy_2427 [Paraburkholderia phymatum STM815]|uniref:Uncharacterized protein n=1 Tax=Paraburkholderia phymatum (strain DSM 17167 / CIP 108236 / LMG 21445 / STM815) TaxID=391038 RepID=B2JFX5_PARP8|nr:hypothetical protein Bphy_2427 [Paraburkholderia phymatum STM815]